MSFIVSDPDRFNVTLEVVPPAGPDTGPLLEKILPIADLAFDGFSVASNPVAKPRMSAMAFACLLQKETGKPAILHFTVRDHNRIGLQAELWGARALGIDTVIAVTGDPSARTGDHPATTVNDLNVYDLITAAGQSGLCAGAVLDYRPEVNGLEHEIKRIEKKAAAGSRFIVTQPVYDHDTALRLRKGLSHIRVPVIMGILPLISVRHAVFLHEKVAGIAVPDALMNKMKNSNTPLETGIRNSGEMLGLAREMFSGACIMPPFDRFDILGQIL
ncbi:MAG: methylenetetrahydrofolate reductase [Desulfobacter sp.]